MIADDEIRGADPAAVIEQYEPYIKKLANRYIQVLNKTGAVGFDDLIQVGRIATLDAQRKYNPDEGSFRSLLFYYVRSSMRKALCLDAHTGKPPNELVYLDEPITEDGEITLADTIPDPDTPPPDEPIIIDETRKETAEQMRAAVDRLKSDKQREIIKRVWFKGQNRAAAAADMGIKTVAAQQLDLTARGMLRRDWRLKRYVMQEMPSFHVGVDRFNTTWTSATEEAVIWLDEHYL